MLIKNSTWSKLFKEFSMYNVIMEEAAEELRLSKEKNVS